MDSAPLLPIVPGNAFEDITAVMDDVSALADLPVGEANQTFNVSSRINQNL